MEADSEKSFVEKICRPFLRNSQNADGGWGFHPQSESRAEPTCWALQALLASPQQEAGACTAAGIQFLRVAQLDDGSWPSTSGEKSGCWVTSLCCWVLQQAGGCSSEVAAGLRWVQQDWPRDTTAWRRFLARFSSQREVHPINTAYRGWGWTPGTSSWVEPTSVALLSLEQPQPDLLPAHVRRRRELAESMLYDRMCPGGGWNSGNARVYGVAGEPLMMPTVWALLALRSHPARRENILSLDWVAHSVKKIQGPGSLALARICMETYQREWPSAAPTLQDLYGSNGFLDSVQVTAWSCLALTDRSRWLAPPSARTV